MNPQKHPSSLKRILIAGPTAIGKSAVAIQLGMHLPISIISADSRQCYRHLDVGTGKVLPQEMQGIRHFNISELDLNESDTAARFAERSRQWEEEIRREGRLPIYVGGSTLHVQSVVWPLDEAPQACVPNLIKLRHQEEANGEEFMLEWLEKVDPSYRQRVEGYNPHRVYRALDVYLQTGKPFSSFHSDAGFSKLSDDTLLVVLTCNRSYLVNRIEQRVDQMIRDGLVEECRRVLDMGHDGTEQALQTVGYKEAIAHIRGEYDLESMREKMLVSTRRYAKRQVTWFKRWKAATFMDVSHRSTEDVADEITALVSRG
ncbi:MAG: tRNA (adenosine(37)-N6)-dimethylallyltransferase MiaA [Balneolales bacterium]|nr:tRNA (adenosine(37)-N6)-dimethylallyltransferase MiaA [Balneolales bacterium]